MSILEYRRGTVSKFLLSNTEIIPNKLGITTGFKIIYIPNERYMQVGIDSFAAWDYAGMSVSPSERLQRLVEQIEYADKIGLDVFGIGEHHRTEFLDSAPVVILAPAAARTKRIRLTSAVTVPSAADPVRVFQEFSTLDLLSQGRAEMVVGRGSSIEAFPLFGFRLEDYDSLFEEKSIYY